MFCENVGFEEHYVTYADYKETSEGQTADGDN